MQILRFCLTLVAAALLGGCLPGLSQRLYNYTGTTIKVYDRQGIATNVENNAGVAIMFVPQPGNSKLEGFLVQMSNKQCFYPLYDLRGQYHVDRTPGGYFESSGFNQVRVNFGIDKLSKLYVLKPASKSLNANKASQPAGFPMQPQ